MSEQALRELCLRWFGAMVFAALAFAGHARTSYRRSLGQRQSTSNGWPIAYLCLPCLGMRFGACRSFPWPEFFNRIISVGMQ